FQRLPGFFVAITNYTRLLIAPFNLHMEYGDKLFSFTDPRAILGVIIVISLIIFAIKRRHKNQLISFAILWFFVTLIPQSNIYPIKAYMAEHWLYLPSIGFFLVIANAGYRLSVYGFRKSTDREPNTEHRKPNLYILAAMALLITFYSVRTIQQNRYWQKPAAFYERTIKYAPESERLHNNLGFLYSKAGESNRAFGSYQKAIEINDRYVEAHYNLANLYLGANMYVEAIASYERVLAIEPDYKYAYNNLGNAYLSIGQEREALSSYKRALEIDPFYALTYYNIANIYLGQFRIEEAIEFYTKSIKIDGDYVDAYNNLGNAYLRKKDYDKAIDAYRKAISLDRAHARAYHNLSLAYENISRLQDAESSLKSAIDIDPQYASAYYRLSIICFKQKRYEMALSYCKRAADLGYKVDEGFLDTLRSLQRD
ncbi:tetratricopeptide repeat protein, partial [Candidatus Omnitrophota bacterium]